MSASQVDPTTVSHAELASFTRQLGAMLHAGVNVLRALRIASHFTGNRALIDASVSISRSLEDGREFHNAIGRHPELFGAFYVEMARQGESDGMLGQALLGVADYLDHLAMGAAPPASSVREVVAVAPAPPSNVATTVLMTLGVLALGAAAVGALAAFRMLDERWLPPVAAAWAGFCLLAGGWLLRRVTPAAQPATPPPTPGLPPKSPQRRAAETEGIVRSALQEQAEEEEMEAQRAASIPDSAKNGRNPVTNELLLPPDERTPPRFDL